DDSEGVLRTLVWEEASRPRVHQNFSNADFGSTGFCCHGRGGIIQTRSGTTRFDSLSHAFLHHLEKTLRKVEGAENFVTIPFHHCWHEELSSIGNGSDGTNHLHWCDLGTILTNRGDVRIS